MKTLARLVLPCTLGLALLAATATHAAIPPEKLDRLKAAIDAHPELADKTRAFAKEKLLPLLDNEILARETAAQNAKKAELEAIKAIDTEWIAAEEPMPLQDESLSNACAEELNNITKNIAAIREAFVMDNQGAVVGEITLTSDYWQGDEAKWKKSFNEGQGGVDAGKPALDKSSNVVLQQVSLPIFDAAGNVIGAVTWGLLISKL